MHQRLKIVSNVLALEICRKCLLGIAWNYRIYSIGKARNDLILSQVAPNTTILECVRYAVRHNGTTEGCRRMKATNMEAYAFHNWRISC